MIHFHSCLILTCLGKRKSHIFNSEILNFSVLLYFIWRYKLQALNEFLVNTLYHNFYYTIHK